MACAIPDQTAKTVAKCFLREIILRRGSPSQLLTDQGTNFTSQLLSEVCKLCNVKKIQTSPYHPQGDGLIERFNRTLATMLSMYVNTRHNDWDLILLFCMFAYNTSVQDSTKFSPFFLLYGRSPKLPPELTLCSSNSKTYIELEEYLTEVSKRISDSWELARANIQTSQDKQKEYYNRKMKDTNFCCGDLVYRYSPAVKVGQSPKFVHPWRGLFEIIDVRYLNVQIRSFENAETKWVHVNLLKKFSSKSMKNCVSNPQNLKNSSKKTFSQQQHKSHTYNLRCRH